MLSRLNYINSMPSKVFLVMTVYNREIYLPAAIDSILNQTYPHWQLTVWDDGSNDRSAEIARQYAQKDTRIHCVAATHHGNQYALRAAFALASNNDNYLAIIDSDDLIAPETLALTVAVLDRHLNFGMLYTNHWIMNAQGQVLGLGVRCQIPYCKNRLLIDFMTFHFRLMRREIYELVGGMNLEFPQAEDYDLCLKISEVTEIYHLEQALYYYRIHADNISRRRQVTQVEFSATAVRKALIRRGLSETYDLAILEGDRFKLVHRK
jgi:glycosyltransferase involved in cell wall biosynthesis